MKKLTVNQLIELAAYLEFDEKNLIEAFDTSKSETEKMACVCLLMACESHERKA